MERQWAAGQLLDTGHRVKDEKGKLVPNRLLLLGADNGIYNGCLVYVDERGKVGTLSTKFYQSYSTLSVQSTTLQYAYSNMERAKADVGLFKPYFTAVAGAEN